MNKSIAEEISDGLCYLLIKAKEIGVGVNTYAEHDIFCASIESSYDLCYAHYT